MHLFDHALKDGQAAGESLKAVTLGRSHAQRDKLFRQRRTCRGLILQQWRDLAQNTQESLGFVKR